MVQILPGSLFFFSMISFVLGTISTHKLRIRKSESDNPPFISRQLSDGSSVTSPADASDNELQINDDVDSDEAVPRKRQKTLSGSNARITIAANVLVKSQKNKSSIVDGGSKKHGLPSLQNFATPTFPAADSENMRVAISNTEPSPTTLISSYVQIDSSPTTVVRTSALSQNAPVKEKEKVDKPTSTQSRKRVIGLSGLLVPRPLAISSSTSTSDSLNLDVLKDHEEPPRKTRGPALRPSNWSYGTKLKKSQGRIADQDELELWTNADVAHIGFRKPDELILLDEVEEESTKRNVSHVLMCLMEMETKSSSENMARKEGVISNCVLTEEFATPESVWEKNTSIVPEWTKMVRNIQAVDGLEGQEDEEMRDDVNSPPQVPPPPQLECWSTTLRSLLKGKKKFQHQVGFLRSLPFFSRFLNSPSGLG